MSLASKLGYNPSPFYCQTVFFISLMLFSYLYLCLYVVNFLMTRVFWLVGMKLGSSFALLIWSNWQKSYLMNEARLQRPWMTFSVLSFAVFYLYVKIYYKFHPFVLLLSTWSDDSVIGVFVPMWKSKWFVMAWMEVVRYNLFHLHMQGFGRKWKSRFLHVQGMHRKI